MSILTRAIAGATLAVVLATPVALRAQPVPSGVIPAAAGSRYDVTIFYAGGWHGVKENVAAASSRAAVASAFAGGYGAIPYEAVSRAYYAKQSFTGIRAFNTGARKLTFHCDLRFRSTTGCRN